jgi:hypothetical protein
LLRCNLSHCPEFSISLEEQQLMNSEDPSTFC